MRILVTGSRNWDEDDWLIIFDAFMQAWPNSIRGDNMVLVSGHCPTGADKMAEDIALKLGWMVETHPAEWDIHGKRAGYVRNAEMVAKGADVCLAFIKNNSPGATMTMELAQKSGIETRVWWRR